MASHLTNTHKLTRKHARAHKHLHMYTPSHYGFGIELGRTIDRSEWCTVVDFLDHDSTQPADRTYNIIKGTCKT